MSLSKERLRTSYSNKLKKIKKEEEEKEKNQNTVPSILLLLHSKAICLLPLWRSKMFTHLPNLFPSLVKRKQPPSPIFLPIPTHLPSPASHAGKPLPHIPPHTLFFFKKYILTRTEKKDFINISFCPCTTTQYHSALCRNTLTSSKLCVKNCELALRELAEIPEAEPYYHGALPEFMHFASQQD